MPTLQSRQINSSVFSKQPSTLQTKTLTTQLTCSKRVATKQKSSSSKSLYWQRAEICNAPSFWLLNRWVPQLSATMRSTTPALTKEPLVSKTFSHNLLCSGQPVYLRGQLVSKDDITASRCARMHQHNNFESRNRKVPHRVHQPDFTS